MNTSDDTVTLAMHIPDNFIAPQFDGMFFAVMIPIWIMCMWQVMHNVNARDMTRLGVGAAFAFLVMMFNVPVLGGTTGHAVGGALIAILLGPESACLSLSMALLLQALLFGDGGVLTYGVNCFNMAFILPFTSYGIYRLLKGFWNTRRGELFAEILGSYIGLNLAAFTAAVVLGVQPLIFHNGEGHALYFPYPLSVTIPAMMIPHLLVVGALEAAITVTVVGFVRRSAPELIHKQTGDVSSARLKVSGKRTRFAFIWVGLLLLAVATPIGLVAGGGAWGEWAADTFMQDTGLSYVPEYIQRGFSFRALLPDYSLKGLPPVAGYLMSAVIGMAVLIIIFKILGHIIANQRQKSVRRAK